MSEKLTFEQRHRHASLPGQLKADEVSRELQAKLWAGLHHSLSEAYVSMDYADGIIGHPWRQVLYRWHVTVLHKPADEFLKQHKYCVSLVKDIIYNAPLHRLFTFLEHVAGSEGMRSEANYLAFALEDSRAAWRLVEGQVVPITSEDQAKAVAGALSEVRSLGPDGAKTHLKNAASYLTQGKWADSVRESIHAVEAVACTFEDCSTLSDALKAMQKSDRPIHPALSKGFLALYGYTADESGIRHALLEDGAPDVSEDEALFMFTACAGFCQYLVRHCGGKR
ncbi:MAG: hypothetical protein V4696_09220 [Pseudomonadota bacterium]